MFSLAFSLLLLLGSVLISLVVSRVRFERKYKFPNVVPGWPLVGNFFDVPYPTGMWAREKAYKYGEMYALAIPRTQTVQTL